MKLLVKFSPLLFFLVFMSCCLATQEITLPSLNKSYAMPIETSPYRMFAEVLVLVKGKVEYVRLGELEDFKRNNPNYAFLIPYEIYSKPLEQLSNGGTVRNDLNFQVKVEQLSTERQLIAFKSIADKSTWETTYEATDKEVFPKTFANRDMGMGFWMLIYGIIGGTIGFFIFKLFFNKYIKPKAVEA
jgi:hypothetical protein